MVLMGCRLHLALLGHSFECLKIRASDCKEATARGSSRLRIGLTNILVGPHGAPPACCPDASDELPAARHFWNGADSITPANSADGRPSAFSRRSTIWSTAATS